MVYKLRTGNAGKVVEGNANGQALLWNETLRGWEPGDVTTAGVYVFETYADLEAAFPAVAGVHTLDETAVYEVAGNLDLDGGRIVISAQGALLVGAPFVQIISDVAAPVIHITGTGTKVQGLLVWNNAATASDDRCAIEVSTPGVQLDNVHCLTAGDCPTLLITNAAATVLAIGCQFQCAASTPARAAVRVEAGVFRGIGCERVGPAPFVASFGLVSGIYLDSCFASATGAASDYFAYLSGSVLDEFIATNCRFGENDAAAIGFISSSMGYASVLGCSASGPAGIDWPAANIPVRGLTVVACNFDCTVPFDNFDEADGRVNIKACTGSAGLLSETAIVA
jgi:hypothetical protein